MKKIALLLLLLFVLVSCWTKIPVDQLSESKKVEIDTYLLETWFHESLENFVVNFWTEKLLLATQDENIQKEFLLKYDTFIEISFNKLENKFNDIDFSIMRNELKNYRKELEKIFEDTSEISNVTVEKWVNYVTIPDEEEKDQKIETNNLTKKDLIKIFKLYKEGKRWADWNYNWWEVEMNYNDNFSLYAILFHIKKSYYFWQAKFILEWNKNLEKEYYDTLEYFKKESIGNFSEEWNKEVELHLMSYKKEEYPFCYDIFTYWEKNSEDFTYEFYLDEDDYDFDEECREEYKDTWYKLWISLSKSMNIRNSIAEWAWSDVRIYN